MEQHKNRNVTHRLAGFAVIMVLAMACTASAQSQVISSKDADVSETGLGNLVADAVRQAADADIALVPASMLRSVEIEIAKVSGATVSQAVVDADEAIVVMNLTGTQVREALERSVSLAPKPNKGFLQISGLLVEYQLAAASGSRVRDVKLGKQALDSSATYSVAMPRTLATGGLGYFRVWGSTKPQAQSFGSMSSAVTDFLRGNVDLSAYVPQGRIRRS